MFPVCVHGMFGEPTVRVQECWSPISLHLCDLFSKKKHTLLVISNLEHKRQSVFISYPYKNNNLEILFCLKKHLVSVEPSNYYQFNQNPPFLSIQFKNCVVIVIIISIAKRFHLQASPHSVTLSQDAILSWVCSLSSQPIKKTERGMSLHSS